MQQVFGGEGRDALWWCWDRTPVVFSQWSCPTGMETGGLSWQEWSAQDRSGSGSKGVSPQTNTVMWQLWPGLKPFGDHNQESGSKFYLHPQRECSPGVGTGSGCNWVSPYITIPWTCLGTSILLPQSTNFLSQPPCTLCCFDLLIGSGRGHLTCMGNRLCRGGVRNGRHSFSSRVWEGPAGQGPRSSITMRHGQRLLGLISSQGDLKPI